MVTKKIERTFYEGCEELLSYERGLLRDGYIPLDTMEDEYPKGTQEIVRINLKHWNEQTQSYQKQKWAIVYYMPVKQETTIY